MEAKLKPHDPVLFIDRKGRRYLKMLRPGTRILIRGEIPADDLIGTDEGSRVKLSTGETFLVLRPTYADLIPHLPRQAQVIYPKDTGPLLIWGDVFPGATVIEGGVGAGALTIALLRAVGPAGRVISYELREDFAAAARRNVAAFFGEAPNWTLKVGDLYAGFAETGVDRLFLDLAEPGRALGVAARALRAGGVLVCYVPTAIQLGDTVGGARTRRRLRRSRIVRDAAAQLARQGSERAPGASDGRALGLHHRVAPPGLVLAGRRRAASCAGRIAGKRPRCGFVRPRRRFRRRRHRRRARLTSGVDEGGGEGDWRAKSRGVVAPVSG